WSCPLRIKMDSAEYPASSLVRASPPPQTALPVSHELPVDCCQSPLGFPVLRLVPLPACRRYYPGRTDGLVPSFSPIDFGLPRIIGGSAPALAVSGPAQRSLALRPADLPSRQKRPSTPKASAASLPPLLLRLLPGGANQFPGWDFHPLGSTPFSR